MKAGDMAERALVFDADDSVARVIAGMLGKNRHEAIVLRGSKPVGVVFAHDLVKRRPDPTKSKIGRFAEHVKPVGQDTPIEEIIKSMLANDYKSVPVYDGKAFSFVTKLGVLKAVMGSKEIASMTAADVMNPPHCVGVEDDVSTAISVLRETGVSRLPVVDSADRVEGIVDSLSILRADVASYRVGSGEATGEKNRLGGIGVTSFMIKDFPRVASTAPLRDVVNAMLRKGVPTAIVEDGGKLVGIITPKPMLRLFASRPEGPYIRVSGTHEESDYIKSLVHDELGNAIRKMGGVVPIHYIVVDVSTHNDEGGRKKYSVKSRLITSKGMFFAKDHEWDLTKAVGGVFNKLEREVMKKTGKDRQRQKLMRG